MSLSPQKQVRHDAHTIARTLIKLALPRLLLRLIVIGVVVVIWLIASRWILNVGKHFSYDMFKTMGQPVLDLLHRINPYIWWTVTAIWSLIVVLMLRFWLRLSLAAGRATIITTATLSQLLNKLSPQSIKVINWAWNDRSEPITIGVLNTALTELKTYRIEKINVVAEQTALLDNACVDNDTDNATMSARSRQERHPIEPHISSPRRT